MSRPPFGDCVSVWQDGWAHGHRDGWEHRGAALFWSFFLLWCGGAIAGAAAASIVWWVSS